LNIEEKVIHKRTEYYYVCYKDSVILTRTA